MIVKSKWAALAGLCVSAGAFAEHHAENEEVRDHQAHVHGEVSFNIAQDGEDLIIAISAPGADIVGFEHAPDTAQEKETLKQAIARLENPASLFTFDQAAQCQLSDHLIEQSLSAHDEHGEDHHDEHDEDHHDEHDEDHHDEHDEHNEGSHAAFEIAYQYQCHDVAALSVIKTSWFKHFPNTQEIHVNLLTDKSQNVLELTAKNADINF